MGFFDGFGIGDAISGVGAVLGGLGGLFGASAQEQAGERQADILEEQSEEALKLKELMLRAQLADVVDARGNRISYDDEKEEWTVTLSNGTRELLNASDLEELNRITVDAPIARRGRQANEARRGVEGQLADRILREYAGGSPYTAAGIEGDLITRGVRGVNDQYEGLEQNVTRQATRSGTSGGALLGQLGKARGKSIADAILNAQISAKPLYEQLESSWGGRKLGDYNTLAARASNYDDVAFNPTGIPNQLTGTQGNRAAMLPGAISGAGDMLSNITGMLTDATGARSDAGFYGTLGTGANALAQALASLFDNTTSKTKTAGGSSYKLGNQGTA